MKKTIDLSQMPRYSQPELKFAQLMKETVADAGIIILYSLLVFGGSFVLLLHYDMR